MASRDLLHRTGRAGVVLAAWLVAAFTATDLFAADPLPGRNAASAMPRARFHFGGPVGQRIDANARQWTVRAPRANPGMLAMFALRDREPKPNLMPWAGEFVGKYLIGAIQSLRMQDDPEVEKTVAAVVKQLIAAQAEDGYLGPFPKDSRLLANWDLWGHYHCMLALLMWHERTGDPAALATCRKAADLMCKIYLNTGRRMLSAGSDEMNLAVIHGLGRLFRVTREPRYLALMREVEKDWEKAGDYFRTGLAAVEYFRIPRPRWESFHDLEGLPELYFITGNDAYRRSFINHWQSIRRWERHNNGAFSSGEQATGNPYAPNAIETCCTVAWMAITVDMLALSGDPIAADELELSTFNGMLGAQHPSGNWCTYNTPMDGSREASHHTIVFQARAGTPDLNCCSVNGPRGWGMLSEWAVLRDDAGLVLNYYGPMQADCPLADGALVRLTQETRYPLEGDIRVTLKLVRPREFTLKFRIPAWAQGAEVVGPDGRAVQAVPGTYLALARTWKSGDTVQLRLPMGLRYEAGDLEMAGRISIYRGPILLAYDQRLNAFDDNRLPTVAVPKRSAWGFDQCGVQFPTASADALRAGDYPPWLVVSLPTGDAKQPVIRLCDFASAGASGQRYVSWLPARNILPPPPVADKPADGAKIPPGMMVFSWRRIAVEDPPRNMAVLVSDSPRCDTVLLRADAAGGNRLVIPADKTTQLKPGGEYYWKVVASNAVGSVESLGPYKRFTIDASLTPLGPADLTEYGERSDGLVVAADLAGDAKPSYGKLVAAKGCTAAAGPDGKPGGAVALDGRSGMLTYALKAFPASEFTFAVWFNYDAAQGDRFGQIVSAWDHGGDDPLRVCITGRKLYLRMEAPGSGGSITGIPLPPGAWHHVAAVKSEGSVSLYLDGKPAGSMAAPAEISTSAKAFALGGNPRFTGGPELLACRVAKMAFWCRAMSPEAIAEIYAKQRPR